MATKLPSVCFLTLIYWWLHYLIWWKLPTPQLMYFHWCQTVNLDHSQWYGVRVKITSTKWYQKLRHPKNTSALPPLCWLKLTDPEVGITWLLLHMEFTILRFLSPCSPWFFMLFFYFPALFCFPSSVVKIFLMLPPVTMGLVLPHFPAQPGLDIVADHLDLPRYNIN